MLNACKGIRDEDWRLTQGFGGNRAYYSKWGMEGHDGLDLAGPNPGDKVPIYSPIDGECTVKPFMTGGYGNWVTISNGKEEHVLAHFDSICVESGEVKAGDELGIMGTSGGSTGVHLHWSVRRLPKKNNGYSGRHDFFDEIENWTELPNNLWNMSNTDYLSIMKIVEEDTGIKPIFDNYEGEDAQVKALLTIGLLRLEERLRKDLDN